MNTLNSEEYFELLNHLDAQHGVFYHLWDMGKPVFSKAADKAGVRLSDNGDCIEFLINKEFWETLTLEQKTFVICHECLHVALNHGHRLFKNAKDKQDANILNYATDVVINHTLVDKFGMSRENIDPNNDYCWIDTVFPDGGVPEKKSSEFYYTELLKNPPTQDCPTVDDHKFFEPSESSDDMSDIIKELDERLGDGEKSFIEEIVSSNEELDGTLNEESSNEAGSSPGNIFTQVDTKKKKPKRKWESVINKWARNFIIEKDRVEMQWVRMNRRFALINGNNMFIPSEMEIEDKDLEKRKVDVWFFQDTSGSCRDYAQRFFDAAKTLPQDTFNIRLFCFDTSVYETTLASGKLHGFGGTSFTCIESHIQKLMRNEGCDYPKAVFVITDGYGDHVQPQKPRNWYWFLTPDGAAHYIPENSKSFDLVNYE